ncbi:hypothetical protein ACH3VR_18465 [Microbacterium sp. B2969]|uniref:Uncharacterized protein n=1 Tax=Microbacterium alkaliflavum TaxID=3248839 RepID=A0ABW7QBS8_9MICO
MDLLDRVRDWGSEIELPEERLAAARQRLAAAVSAEPARRRRWKWTIGVGGGMGGLAIAAAATVTTIVIAGAPDPIPTTHIAATPTPDVTPTPTPDVSVAPPPQPTAPTVPASPTVPTATDVLERAAVLAVTSVTPLTQGQYLRVRNQTEQLVLFAQGVNENSPYDVSRQAATAAWISRSGYSTYIPAERSGEWVREFETDPRIAVVYGAEGQFRADEWRGLFSLQPMIEHFQGGLDFVGDGGATGPIYASDEYFAQLPRNPAALFEWHRNRLAAGNVVDPDAQAVQVLIQDLELNAAPADLRQAMFRALAIIEGTTIESVDGSVTTLGFTFPVSQGVRSSTLSIDTDTGLVVASTSTFRELGGSIVPDSVPDFRVTTTVSVVDSAP